MSINQEILFIILFFSIPNSFHKNKFRNRVCAFAFDVAVKFSLFSVSFFDTVPPGACSYPCSSNFFPDAGRLPILSGSLLRTVACHAQK